MISENISSKQSNLNQPDQHWYTTKSDFNQKTNQLITTIGLAFVFAVFASEMAHAGTGGTEFDAINNRIVDMVEGGGGKLAAALGLVAALVVSVIRFNIWAVIGAFGIGAMAGYGIPIVTSSISATL